MAMEKSSIDILWVIVAAGLVFLMQGGFLCLEASITRTKNSINVATKNLTDFGSAILLFWAFGFGLMFGVTEAGLIGTTAFLTPIGSGVPWLSAFFLYQAMFCGTAVTIISGAVAERPRFIGYICVALFVGGLIYPLFGHWAWGGAYSGASGWLAELGFVDFAGSTVVHGVGGWAALAVIVTIGPRRGRFAADGTPRRMPASNFPFAMLGVLLLWLGWIGFNGGSTLEMSDRVPGIVANTILAGCAGLVTALIFGWIRRSFPDPTLVINGSLAGLVSITASVFAVDAVPAVIIGSTGAIVMLVAEHVLLRLRIDDAIGAVPVHAAAGVWGTLAVAIFGAPEQLATGLNFWGQLLAQASGIVTCAAIAFGGTYLFAAAFKRVIPLRVSAEAEEAGLNVAEHRASTDSWGLLLAMHNQAVTADLTTRVPVGPFTEIGEIAASYNAVLSALEESDTRQRHAATHDSMTDLLNRTNFESAIETMIGDRRSSHGSVVFFLDLDQFKEVNDSMGHLAGDRLLKRVGDVLKDTLRATDVVGRVGGDEFAVFLPATGLDEARTVAEKVLATIRESALTVESQIVKTTTSIGVAEVRTRDTVGGLITRADLAMYHAKKNGGNRIAVYSEGEDWEEEVESRLRIQRLVSLAIKDDLLELHAQPILDLRTNMITRYELLVRLHDGHDLLTAETFVKIAERSGLIQSIDRWVVGKAIGLLSGNQSNRRHLRLAVNLSAKTLDDKELLLLVERQLSSTRIDATNLIFEVTETAAINDMGSAQGFLRRLKELGCQIALDDFGVGQSSLSNLKNLPVDVLKIDGGFIGNLAQDVTDQRLVRSIVDAARAVGAETVAEFVEDEATVECLRKIGVDYAQGYHIGRPGGVSKAFHEPKSKAA